MAGKAKAIQTTVGASLMITVALLYVNTLGFVMSVFHLLIEAISVPFVKILNNDYRDLIFRLSLSHGNGSAVASVFVMKIL